MKILAAIHDLMFSSKVNAAAQGAQLVWLPRGGDLPALAAAELPDAILLDLGARSFDALSALRGLKASEATRHIPVLAYADHTSEQTIRSAQEAGAAQVFSKGEFARRLPALFAGGPQAAG
jgi:two-component system cell cycle response regulator DivK